jgi:monoamine oxidase
MIFQMKNNATKTPLFLSLKKALQLALRANRQSATTEETLQRAEEAALARRKFIENTSKTLLLGSLTGGLVGKTNIFQSISRVSVPRIVIVGGGIAGLNALHTLRKAGADATIYEASGRTSGRIFTVQNAIGDGTWAEFGAEFIDSNHEDIWKLIKEFDLQTIDYAQNSESALIKEAFFFENEHKTLKQVVAEFRLFADKIAADAARLPNNLSTQGYKTTDPFVKELDRLSLSEYLEQIGAKDWIKDFIECAYESEYGLSPQVQSAINLPILISTDTQSETIELFGESDERFKVRGGNQLVPDTLAQKYAAHIETNRALESIRHKGTHYLLQFSGKTEAVKADFVILALPFSRLKNVETRLELSPLKIAAINTLGFGTNAKLMLGMKTHFWRTQSFQGLCYSDVGIPNGWDNAQLQTPDSAAAGLSILFGGPSGIAVGEGTPEFQKNIYLPKWNQIFKGAAENYNGKVARMHWPSQPFTLGSYICYKTGQYTTIAGAEVEPVGNVFFAGEHCGGEFSGFMNGAAKSGREAAQAILAKL